MYGKPQSGADRNILFFSGSEATNFFSKVVAAAVGLDFFLGGVTTTKIFFVTIERSSSNVTPKPKNRHTLSFVFFRLVLLGEHGGGPS